MLILKQEAVHAPFRAVRNRITKLEISLFKKILFSNILMIYYQIQSWEVLLNLLTGFQNFTTGGNYSLDPDGNLLVLLDISSTEKVITGFYELIWE